MPTEAQKRAIESRKRQVIVTASAGAGKTTTMVTRVIDLIVKDNVPISSIIMLTFAEAAAAEMKSKLAITLVREIKNANGETRRALVDALDHLPLLHCSTIDSFCYSLVKAHFEHLGLPPTISLVSEETASSYRKKAMKETLDAFAKESFGEKEEEYYRFISSFGKKEDGALEEYIEKLYDYAEKTEDGDAFLQRAEDIVKGSIDDHPAIKVLLEDVTQRAQIAKESIEEISFIPPDGETEMGEKYAEIQRILDELSDCRSLRSLSRLIQEADALRFTICPSEKKKYKEDSDTFLKIVRVFTSWKKKLTFLKDGVKMLKGDFAAISAEMRLASADVLTLITLTKRFKEIFRGIKAQEEVLDFADVEHCALALLQEPSVSAEIGCTHLMMDESQDLNRLQEALMRALVRKGNLFIVGDVKQSIFRFRLADPELFRRRVRSGENDPYGADVISFDENFRSSDAVIDFVNTVFGNLMTEAFGGIDYPPANRGERHSGSGKVSCFFYPKKDGTEKAEKAPVEGVYSVEKATESTSDERYEDREAEWVRDRILELVRPAVGKTVLRDVANDREFTVSYKDIAILSRVGMKHDNLQERVVSCLRKAGIPVNVGSFVRNGENTDIYALADFLRLIVSKRNDYALLSVLRSDLFSFTVDELALISQKEGNSFSEKAEMAAADLPKLAEFYEYLKKCRFLSDSLSLYELVSRVIDERFRLTVPRRADGRAAMGQILAFAETLKGGKETASIPEYLDYFDNYYKMDLEGEVAERDAVTVMTMHKSKGLEFPIVFVIGLGAPIISNKENENLVGMDNEFGVLRRMPGKEKGLLFSLFEQKKKKELKEDYLRLLYVAFTRAKNYLYVSGSVPKEADLQTVGDKETARMGSQLVLSGLNGSQIYYKDYSSEVISLPSEEVAATTVDAEAMSDSVSQLRSAWAYRYRHEKATKTGIKYTVTAINEMNKQTSFPPTLFFPELSAARGTAYHTVMEYISFSMADVREASATLRSLIERGVISEEEGGDISAKRLYEGARMIGEVIGDRRVYREKSFLLHISAREVGIEDIDDEIEVQGKLDLLAIGEGDAVIVDYKLSRLSKEELIETYCRQLSLYEAAVRKSFGIDRIRKYIFVLGRNELIEL